MCACVCVCARVCVCVCVCVCVMSTLCVPPGRGSAALVSELGLTQWLLEQARGLPSQHSLLPPLSRLLTLSTSIMLVSMATDEGLFSCQQAIQVAHHTVSLINTTHHPLSTRKVSVCVCGVWIDV